jgi:hypothetical protein
MDQVTVVGEQTLAAVTELLEEAVLFRLDQQGTDSVS